MTRRTRANNPTFAKDILYDPRCSVYNATETSVGVLRAALAASATSGVPLQILSLGDSITQGVTSTPEVNFNWPKRMRDALTASGRFGTVGEGCAFNSGQFATSYDPRWSNSGTFTGRQVGGLMNNSMWQAASGTGLLSFGPVTCDTFVIYYVRHTIGGSWTWNVDGGSATTVNSNGAISVQSTTFSAGSLGAHTLNIIPPASSNFAFILGVGFYNSSARNQLEVITGGGFSGQTSNALLESTAVGFGTVSTVAAIAPALTCILLGRNDAAPVNGVGPGQYQANLTTMITSRRNAGGDVILISPPPCQRASYVNDVAIMQALYTLADQQNVALIDIQRLFGFRWNAAPYNMSADNIHPNDAGSVLLGRAVAALILSL